MNRETDRKRDRERQTEREGKKQIERERCVVLELLRDLCCFLEMCIVDFRRGPKLLITVVYGGYNDGDDYDVYIVCSVWLR